MVPLSSSFFFCLFFGAWKFAIQLHQLQWRHFAAMSVASALCGCLPCNHTAKSMGSSSLLALHKWGQQQHDGSLGALGASLMRLPESPTFFSAYGEFVAWSKG